MCSILTGTYSRSGFLKDDKAEVQEQVLIRWQAADNAYATYFERKGIQPDCARCHKAHCCRQLALSTEEEALMIRRQVKTWPQKKQKALNHRLAALPNVARENFRGDCPFLINERCSIYAVRPMACRIFHSLNKSKCKRRRKALDASLYSLLSEQNVGLRKWLEDNGGSAKVVAMPIWMKYHIDD